MSRKKLFIILGSIVAVIAVLIILKKSGKIGDNDDSKIVEVSKAETMTIIETVSATGKFWSFNVSTYCSANSYSTFIDT